MRGLMMLLLVLSLPARANLLDQTLEASLERASVVVHGRVLSSDENSPASAGAYAFQAVEVSVVHCYPKEATFCRFGAANARLVNPLGSSETVSMSVGGEYLMLVNLVSRVPLLGGGVHSVLPVSEGRVDTSNFTGSPTSLSLKEALAIARAKVRGCGKLSCPAKTAAVQ